MTITFPAWYKGGYPIAEQVAQALLAPYLAQLTPAVTVCTQLPPTYGQQLPIVQVFRMPGGVDPQSKVDHSIIHVGAIAAVPDDDWALYEYVRQVMLIYTEGGSVPMPDGSTALVGAVEEMQGPEQMAEMNPQFRISPGTFHMLLPRPRHLPNYRQLLQIT